MDPRVAMLSFSTKGSAKSDDVEKVANAVKLAQEKVESEGLDNVVVDGEFQFDAAIVPAVAEKKKHLEQKFKVTQMYLYSQV